MLGLRFVKKLLGYNSPCLNRTLVSALVKSVGHSVRSLLAQNTEGGGIVPNFYGALPCPQAAAATIQSQNFPKLIGALGVRSSKPANVVNADSPTNGFIVTPLCGILFEGCLVAIIEQLAKHRRRVLCQLEWCSISALPLKGAEGLSPRPL